MSNLWQFLGSVVLAFGITLLLIPILIRKASSWHLTDKPGGRKKHLRVTPVVGGIAMGIGFLVSWVVSGLAFQQEYLPFIIYMVVLLITGVVDDIRGLSPAVKWGGQVMAALFIVMNGAQLNSFHGVFGVGELAYWLAIPLSIVLFTGTINAVNLMDGVDGLVGGICAFNFTIFGVLFYLRNDVDHATIAFILAACLLAFLILLRPRFLWAMRVLSF